jgi:hypothetical protein
MLMKIARLGLLAGSRNTTKMTLLPERIQAARLSPGAVPLLPRVITKVVPGKPDEGQCAKRPPRAARRKWRGLLDERRLKQELT